jgi:hypothetical protein
MPPTGTWSSNGGGNLFLEADPDTSPTQSQPQRAGARRPRRRPREQGRIMPVGPSSAAGAPRRPDAAAFTQPGKRPGSLKAKTREHLRRADANARRLAAQLASRPYTALIALALVGAALLALSWMGLALRNAGAARHSADRRAAAATAALRQERHFAANAVQHDQTRIAALHGQLEQARDAVWQRPAPIVSASAKRTSGKPTNGRAHGH